MSFIADLQEIVENSQNPLLATNENWGRVRLGDVAAILNGYAFQSSRFSKDHGMPLIRIRDLDTKTTVMRYDGDYEPQYLMRRGALLVGMDGEFKVARWSGDRGLLNQRVCRIVADSTRYDSRFLEFALPGYLGAIHEATSSQTVKHLSSKDLASIPLPNPPLLEQRRIAGRIETLLARLSNARDRLQNNVLIARKARRAILRAAVNGDLTKKWRSDHQAREWCTSRASDACAVVQSGGTPKTGFVDSGVPFLKVYNLVNQRINFDYRSQFVPIEVHQKALRKSITLPDDVVMNIVGPPMGKVAVLTTQFPEWNINQALALFRPSDRVTSGWLYILLRDGRNVQEVMNDTKGIVGQVNISLSQCRDFEFPIPSIAEQQEIVRRVDSLLALIDAIEKRVNTALARAARLTQSILAKAFAGELVPTEAELARREGRDYEPASVLLERITQKRAVAAKSARSSPRKRSGK